jgi:Mn2+/Fe2+ NRAMP family transporter
VEDSVFVSIMGAKVDNEDEFITFLYEQGLDKKFHEAKGFYTIIAISLLLGLSLNYIGISPIDALIYTAVLYGLTAPVLIAIILHISNNKKI